jgi:uncharacterized protein (DUF58 family)
MISPAPRLIAATAAAGITLAAMYAVSPTLLPGIAVLCSVLVLLAALDATSAGRALRRITVHMPEMVRLTAQREGSLPITISREEESSRAVHVNLALSLPEELQTKESSVDLQLADRIHLDWPVTAQFRGRYPLDAVYLQGTSWLGLWRRRVTFPVQCELRAYPNLLEDRRGLAAIFLNRGAIGTHAQRQVGKGKEFEKLRDYVPGDSYQDIDWKGTAKRARPITREFQTERTQEIYVVVDASRLSGRPLHGAVKEGGAPATQLERFITSALVLGLVAQQQGDLFGLCTFSDRVEHFARARTGHAHHRSLRDALYTLQPRRVNPDFSEVCTFLRLRLRRRALIFFLTNLDDEVLAEDFARDVRLLSRQHIVLANTLNLPGIAPLFSNGGADSAEGIYRDLAGHLQWKKLREAQGVLKQYGATLTMLDSAAMAPQLVSQYMDIKRRQAL